jgi:prepilin-type N-terminal cleavage/methylation domain-containing protein
MLRTPPASIARAFTLLELMIVILVLALLAALALPRLSGTESRRFDLTADRLSDLLMVFAQRDSMGGRPVALIHSADRNQIELLTLDIDPFQPDLLAEWRPDRLVPFAEWRLDRLVPSVPLPTGIRVVDCRVDGDLLVEQGWSIISEPGQERPVIEMTLASGDRMATLVLSPAAVAASRYDANSPAPYERASVDLDAAGRNREDW